MRPVFGLPPAPRGGLGAGRRGDRRQPLHSGQGVRPRLFRPGQPPPGAQRHDSIRGRTAPASQRPVALRLHRHAFGKQGGGLADQAVSGAVINATLEIAGRGKLDYEAQLNAMVDPAKVRLVGYQDAEVFMRNIDVLVVPSLWDEPFGLVAVEACARHLPVIATDMGGLPEIIQDNLNGLICSPNDPDSLGRAMLRLYLDSGLRQRLSRQARASVAPFLNTERMLDQYQSILHA